MWVPACMTNNNNKKQYLCSDECSFFIFTFFRGRKNSIQQNILTVKLNSFKWLTEYSHASDIISKIYKLHISIISIHLYLKRR
jgi:hypothetical protein